jgi:subtilisin inhibitor-like
VGPLARAALALVVLLAAGCGSGGGGAGNRPKEPRFDLTITFWPQGRDGPSRTATLTCVPDGGTHPDPDKACAALRAHPQALDPVPPDTACTEIYGGDQVARVTGEAGLDDPEQGRLTIDALLNRTNGCEITRWDELAPLLELPG